MNRVDILLHATIDVIEIKSVCQRCRQFVLDNFPMGGTTGFNDNLKRFRFCDETGWIITH